MFVWFVGFVWFIWLNKMNQTNTRNQINGCYTDKFPGDHSVEATPVPIPNTEVKLYHADDTAGVTLWESR